MVAKEDQQKIIRGLSNGTNTNAFSNSDGHLCCLKTFPLQQLVYRRRHIRDVPHTVTSRKQCKIVVVTTNH